MFHWVRDQARSGGDNLWVSAPYISLPPNHYQVPDNFFRLEIDPFIRISSSNNQFLPIKEQVYMRRALRRSSKLVKII